MPDSKKGTRTIMAVPLEPVRLVANEEEMMRPMKRNIRMRRGFTMRPAKAVRKRPTANTVCATAW